MRCVCRALGADGGAQHYRGIDMHIDAHIYIEIGVDTDIDIPLFITLKYC